MIDERKRTNVVFGTGICMQNNWRLIEKNFKPDCFTDNASSKWGTFPVEDDRKCISPNDVLSLENPHVLIAIGDPYAVEAVKCQLEEMGISYIALLECLDDWGSQEELPERLQKLELPHVGRRVLLFNSPEHDNIGDHLISEAELTFINRYFSDCECIEITDIEYLWFHKIISSYIKKEDIIMITGGGYLGSLWLYNGELNVRNIITEYPDNKIVIMPQTVFFEENERGKRECMETVEVYSKHKNLTICLREKKSYQIMNQLLGSSVNIVLIPDMALFLKGNEEESVRKDVLLCLRKDKESIMSDEMKSVLKERLKERGYKYSETLMHTGKCFNIDDRIEEVKQKALQLKSAGVVVTDTLHCMILCALTGTPCLAFDNLSGKVSNVYEWISDLPYIQFYVKRMDILDEIQVLMSNGAGQYRNERLMSHYDRLAEIISEDK